MDPLQPLQGLPEHKGTAAEEGRAVSGCTADIPLPEGRAQDKGTASPMAEGRLPDTEPDTAVDKP